MECDLVGSLQVWDFKSLKPESALTGHGGDVKACDWHPSKGAIASGSKDATVKLWDPRAGDACLSTLELHKAPISQVSWNQNGNWLLSASRDQQLAVWALVQFLSVHKAVSSVSLPETQKRPADRSWV